MVFSAKSTLIPFKFRRLLLLVFLSIWTVTVAAAIVLLLNSYHSIEELYHLPTALLPIAVSYKTFFLITGWTSAVTVSRRSLFTHVYSIYPLVIFAIVMMGSSFSLLGYLLTPAEALHMLVVYSVIAKLPEQHSEEAIDFEAPYSVVFSKANATSESVTSINNLEKSS